MTEDDAGALPPGCPMDLVLKFLAREWTAHVVWILGRQGVVRFGALRRALPGEVSARVLSARLKHLESLGFVYRNDIGTVPPHVEYSLTDQGRLIDGLLVQLNRLSNQINLPESLKRT